MNIRISPSKISGTIAAPPSKSATHRALILAALARGTSQVKNMLLADDTLHTLHALQAFGVTCQRDGVNVQIVGTNGELQAPNAPISLGLAGTSMRLLTGVAALAQGESVLTGENRLCQRPIKDLVEALASVGIHCEYLEKKGYPPIKVHGGRLRGGTIYLSGKISSQYLSALLLIAPFAAQPVEIVIVDQLKSQPYVALTLGLMQTFGVSVKNQDYQRFRVECNQHYIAQEHSVEGDYSSASYLFAAAAVSGGRVNVTNLNLASTQGDKIFPELLRKMGCKVENGEDSIAVEGTERLNGIVVDLKNTPDIVQTLAVVAASAKGVTKIENIGHLKYKETDRIQAVVSELTKMGVQVMTDGESLTVFGKGASSLHGVEIETYNDHRMAMSFAIAGLELKGETIIKDAGVVSKSYPHFFADLAKLGAKIG